MGMIVNAEMVDGMGMMYGYEEMVDGMGFIVNADMV